MIGLCSSTFLHTSLCADLLLLAKAPWATNITAVTAYISNIVTGIATFAGGLAARGFPIVLVSNLMAYAPELLLVEVSATHRCYLKFHGVTLHAHRVMPYAFIPCKLEVRTTQSPVHRPTPTPTVLVCLCYHSLHARPDPLSDAALMHSLHTAAKCFHTFPPPHDPEHVPCPCMQRVSLTQDTVAGQIQTAFAISSVNSGIKAAVAQLNTAIPQVQFQLLDMNSVMQGICEFGICVNIREPQESQAHDS